MMKVSALRNLCLAISVGVCAMPALADEMPFQGTTSGSFSAPTSELTFAGTSFGPSMTSGGSFTFDTLNPLGTFTVTLASSGSTTLGGTFTLTVTFTIPDGAGNPTFDANVTGTINTQNANNVFIDFGAGQTINYSGAGGSGSFLFTVNDVTFPQQSQTGDMQYLTGSISDAVFNPSTPPSEVPEPGSVGLLLTAIGGVAFSLYRKRSV